MVVLGGLPLGGDNLSDCRPFRLAIGRSRDSAVGFADLMGEVAFLVEMSSFLLGEDVLGVVVGTEVGGSGCLRE